MAITYKQYLYYNYRQIIFAIVLFVIISTAVSFSSCGGEKDYSQIHTSAIWDNDTSGDSTLNDTTDVHD